MKKTLSLIVALAMILACVPALAAGSVKIGVLVSDSTSSEALAFRAYYTEYIAPAYGVEFIYSDELTDAAGEKSAIDNFIVNNCKAVISFSSFDRPAQIDQCESAGIYYAVATGTLNADEYEEYKDYEYYVGAIGPSLDIEFQAGYDKRLNHDWHIYASGNMNFARTMTVYAETAEYTSSMNRWRSGSIGRWNDIVWMYEYAGQFTSEEDIRNWAVQDGTLGNSKELVGDFKYVDQNGDGIIDGNDLVPIAYNGSPKFYYGLSLGATYRNLDFNRIGSIAEASLAVTGIFEEAEKAAKLYLENIRRKANEQSGR